MTNYRTQYEVGDRVRVLRSSPLSRFHDLLGTIVEFTPEDDAYFLARVRFDAAGEQVFNHPSSLELVSGSIADPDMVVNPAHYNWHPSGVECRDIVSAFNFNRGSAIKYVWRAGKKDPSKEIEDLQKAVNALQDEIRRLENE